MVDITSLEFVIRVKIKKKICIKLNSLKAYFCIWRGKEALQLVLYSFLIHVYHN